MRILALLTDGFGGTGGIARYNSDLMQALARTPVIDGVTVLPRNGCDRSHRPDGVEQVRASRNVTAWTSRALSLAMSRRPDVIFCGHLNAAPIASVIARTTSRPMWLQVHGIEAWSDRGPLIRWALDSATLVTSVSRFTRQQLLQWSDIDPSRVRVLPNTVSEAFKPQPPRPDLQRLYQLEGRKVILTVGRMSAVERYKGHDRVLSCLPLLRERIPDVCYLIVGEGDDRTRLETLAATLGVTAAVIFAGAANDAELHNYYALADVFAMPSTGEGFGIAFVEAAACGLPVIGGRADGSWDALREGALGTAIDAKCQEALIRAIVAALEGSRVESVNAALAFRREQFEAQVEALIRELSLSISKGDVEPGVWTSAC